MGQGCPFGALPPRENHGLSGYAHRHTGVHTPGSWQMWHATDCPWGGVETIKPPLLYAAQAG
jgi:hypothetical protein